MKKNSIIKEYSPDSISDEDILQAMTEMSGYVDITPEDFKDIYNHAYAHAHNKISSKKTAEKPSPASGIRSYFLKMKGSDKSPPGVNISEICWSWIGAFLGIAAVAYCNFSMFSAADTIMIIGSFGASAVLIYGAVKSPLAQPRNLIGGHLFSAVIGVASYQCFSSNLWLASALAVATAIAVMHATKTLHPPGGATALIAVIGSQNIHDLGFYYAFVPVTIGALIMLVIALAVNNIPKSRRYPEFWL